MKRFNRNAIAFFSGFALVALVATCAETAHAEPTQAIIECQVQELGVHKIVFNNQGTGLVEFERTGIHPMVWSNNSNGRTAEWARVNGAGTWLSVLHLETKEMGLVTPDGELHKGHCKVLRFTNV